MYTYLHSENLMIFWIWNWSEYFTFTNLMTLHRYITLQLLLTAAIITFISLFPKALDQKTPKGGNWLVA